MNNDIVYEEFLLFAEELVNESGIILKKAFKNKIEYEIKGDQSFITKYDLLIEELFRNRITKKYSNLLPLLLSILPVLLLILTNEIFSGIVFFSISRFCIWSFM